MMIAKQIISSFTGDETHFEIVGKSHFRTNLEGSEKDFLADMANGRITRRRLYRRDGKILPAVKAFAWLLNYFRIERSFAEMGRDVKEYLQANTAPGLGYSETWEEVVTALEAMVSEGWLVARTEPGARTVPPIMLDFSKVFHENRDVGLIGS
jgi:hypothetical protein